MKQNESKRTNYDNAFWIAIVWERTTWWIHSGKVSWKKWGDTNIGGNIALFFLLVPVKSQPPLCSVSWGSSYIYIYFIHTRTLAHTHTEKELCEVEQGHWATLPTTPLGAIHSSLPSSGDDKVSNSHENFKCPYLNLLGTVKREAGPQFIQSSCYKSQAPTRWELEAAWLCESGPRSKSEFSPVWLWARSFSSLWAELLICRRGPARPLKRGAGGVDIL